MSWADLDSRRADLDHALAAYDWKAAAAIAEEVIQRTRSEDEPCPAAPAIEFLGALRRKRQFDLLSAVAEAFLLSGQHAAGVRRHYAQSLIERGLLVAPEPILQALSSEPPAAGNQVVEARGLLGRLFKQRYVAMRSGRRTQARAYFERALGAYLDTYRLDPAAHYWHGINVVALIHLGRADGVPVPADIDPDRLARDILAALDQVSGGPDPFELATRVEGWLAVGDHRRAEEAALDYSRQPGADAFEFGSTLRQLEEVWQLTGAEPPGSTLLPILRAARMRAEKGAMQAAPVDVDAEIEKIHDARARLEKVFGADRTVTLQWYEMGLQRTRSVARVERLDGKGHGTGWLVDARDFFADLTGPLLLTNAHVINRDGTGGALTPDQAQANFQGLKTVFEFEDEIVWTSPPGELDATFLRLRSGVPAAEPLPLASRKVRPGVPPPRLYIIGHPAGRDVELSLHDNKLLACNERLLHYRTPTEGGSSGSPVFEETAWKVIGLHHAGGWYAGLDGKTPPEYEANEGIPILAIQEAARRATSTTGG